MSLSNSEPRKLTFPIPRIDVPFEAAIAQLLDEAGVPNFIWGEPYLSYIGTSTGHCYSAWVVPDNCIDKAAVTLRNAGFPPCIKGSKCIHFIWDATHPWPDRHFHTDHVYPEIPERATDHVPEGNRGVHLFKKSRLFPSFKDPVLGTPAPDDRYYMTTADPRIKAHPRYGIRRRQADDHYPVRMPVPARYFEALLLLRLRDALGHWTEIHWYLELISMITPDRVLGLNLDLDDLEEPFKEWGKRFAIEYSKGNHWEMVNRYFCELYLKFKREGRLPEEDSPRYPLCAKVFDEHLRELNIPFEESDLT
ncbi:hypothetical protein BJX99DRAFT_265124 [Aspergillus californicus]